LDILEKLVGETHIFVDTCSLMHEASDRFFGTMLKPVLLARGAKIVVPARVVEEVNRLQRDRDEGKKAKAHRAAAVLKSYMTSNLVDVRGEDGEPFADNVFHYVFSKFRTQYNLTLITQDRALAEEVAALRYLRSVQSSKLLLVFRLSQYGDLQEWTVNEDRQNDVGSSAYDKRTQHEPLFKAYSKPRSSQDVTFPVRAIPREGDRIHGAGHTTVQLVKVLASGGEGTIYSTSDGNACKIFHKNKITDSRKSKLSLMAGSPIGVEGVCWPSSLALNDLGEFVGYLMPMAHGKTMQKCLFIKPLLMRNFPHWNRQNLVQLAITWLEKVVALHHNNVLIGDVNPMNILIESETKVYLVDTDSYQVEDFPCLVGMANFTAPEIQRKRFSSFIRSPEHEAFAVATMLFMILMPGKPPYSHQGGGDPVGNIMSGNFSYPLGRDSNRLTPDGPWRFIWSHFPYRTKEAFYNCFKEGRRLSSEEWIAILRRYLYDLQEGHLDPSGESLKVFPASFKHVSDYAHDKYGAEKVKFVEFRCDFCGKDFQIPVSKADKFAASRNKTCRDCYTVLKQKHETGHTLTCTNCGREFLFSLADQEFYQKKGYQPPKRCKQCRLTSPSPRATAAQPSAPSVWDAVGEFWKSFWGN
jgi:rRNA-processing protein FCF1